MITKLTKLNDLFTDWYSSNGIFHYLDGFEVPWTNTNDFLDFEYHGNRSGSKFVSPLVNNLLNADGELTSVERTRLAMIIFNKFKEKWNKLYATLELEYNPIENYRMTEEEETVDDKNITDSYTRDRDVSGTNTGTVGNVAGATDTITNQVYGFDNGEPTNKDKSVDSSSSNNTQTNNLANSESEDIEDSSEHNEDNTQNRTLTRSGNIGVTTSQQMIESERNLWMWNFYEQIFKDVDSVLTLKIYN